MPSQFFRTLYLLLLISLGYFVTDVYLPSLPAISESLNTSEILAQSTMFSYLISFSVGPLLFGPLSDRFGRKLIISLGLITCIIATLGCYFSITIWQLLAMRSLQGLGAGAVFISGRSMIPDQFQGKQLAKQLTYISMFMPFILAVAPTIGGILQENFGWRSVFLFLAFYLTAIFILIQWMHESLRDRTKRTFKEGLLIYKSILKNRPFIFFSLGVVFPSVGLFAYFTASPFLFQEIIGLSPAEYGRLSLLVGLAVLTAGTINTQLIKYFPTHKIIMMGSTIMMCTGVTLIIVYLLDSLNTWTLLIPSLFYIACIPFCISNAFANSMNQINNHYGSANALLTFTQFVSGSIGSLIFSLITEKSVFPIGLCFLTIGVLTFINIHIAIYHKRTH